MKAGVLIYEYTPGFVLAKVFVSDNDTATVGTINLDYRSLYHHFECGAYIYNNPVVWDVEKDFQETLSKSQKITKEDLKNRKCRKTVRKWESAALQTASCWAQTAGRSPLLWPSPGS